MNVLFEFTYFPNWIVFLFSHNFASFFHFLLLRCLLTCSFFLFFIDYYNKWEKLAKEEDFGESIATAPSSSVPLSSSLSSTISQSKKEGTQSAKREDNARPLSKNRDLLTPCKQSPLLIDVDPHCPIHPANRSLADLQLNQFIHLLIQLSCFLVAISCFFFIIVSLFYINFFFFLQGMNMRLQKSNMQANPVILGCRKNKKS